MDTMMVKQYHKRNELIHGYKCRKHPLYNTWSNMKRRCYDTNLKSYKNYGGRGITVCDEWLMFKNFAEDMGLKPEGYTLERIDNDKGYFKENCRWATRTEQCLNRRTFENNNCGVTGVTKRISGNYHAKFDINGKRYDLGNFKTIEEANEYRCRFIELLKTNELEALKMTEKKANLNSKTGIRGINPHKKGGFIVKVDGKYAGYGRTLEIAKQVLENARSTTNNK